MQEYGIFVMEIDGLRDDEPEVTFTADSLVDAREKAREFPWYTPPEMGEYDFWYPYFIVRPLDD